MKIKLLTLLAPVLLFACAPQTKTAAPAKPPAGPNAVQVMVLGSYHMGNPGQDVVNVKADNVLTPARQAELAKTADALAAFNPTIIMVERTTAAPDYIDPKYAAFTLANLTTKADETVQIAYRLASQLELKNVYGIDEQPSEGEPDYFPFGPLMEHANNSGQGDIIEADIASIQAEAKIFEQSQSEKSVAELLIESNVLAIETTDFYYDMFKYDRGETQPGAELQAYWFMRNAKIFGKLHQIAKPGDRVLVVYGSGHKHWLEHFAIETPGYVSVDPIPYLENAGK